ncbi:NAD(P)-dependent methylenetetrahydromethanopterin dehydrogenase [Aureliella helgolandensis]|uniref:Bifunctional protein MdtA n=1 Tax=Aureliella helgolandensis TaxID=2527968 RepID=A0A518GAR3_9BACT|nr:NAD(P)-dependent methylenetetrahydromethanopterin dehydrogenase [Aureliella helgolandensis]QDV25694.1 Bifunctional protein MdtA [Aureliella helgolandensis]
MESPRILIQLDSDQHPSVFDAVVAIDSQVDQLLQYGEVEATNARQLVHGAMFTRAPSQLKNTAIFVGGSSVSVGEAIGEEIKQAFFGPVRVSVMLDGNGANTTAAAAVLCAARHIPLEQVNALVLGGTGPVGQRVARLLLGQGAHVALASRDTARASDVCDRITQKMGKHNRGKLTPHGLADLEAMQSVIADKNVVFSCGAAGVTLLPANLLESASKLRVAIDLNAVPPAGIEGVSATDKAHARGQRVDYGAIGVGGLKMKIHREAIHTLFTRNDLVLDAEEIFEIGRNLESASSV